ncbi:SdrD B-like domain-containing protein [Spirosoma litoris]
MSTLHTERLKPVIGVTSSEQRRQFVGKKNQIICFVGQIISYIWELIQGRVLPFQIVSTSSFSLSFTKPECLSSSTQDLVGFDPEPPDILDSGPPGKHVSITKKAYHFFAQQPMNEQFILSKSPHETPPLVDTGGIPVAVIPKSSIGGSLNRLLCLLMNAVHGTTRPALTGALSVVSLLLILLVGSPMQAQAQATINLSLHKSISTQAPAIGDVVTYTIAVANAATASTTATNVSVTDNLPVGGVAFVPGSATITRGSGTYTPTGSATATVGTWSIPSIAPGDSAVVVLKATVLQRGVWFNTAEVAAADQTDANSVPNNQSLLEDDYDAVCFSVPILWYVGDEYTVTIPSGYDQIVWYRDNTPISTSAVSTSLAEVNSDFSLTIKSPGVYRFITYRNGCPATNCCDIQMIQGPYGSLGDFVWLDTNKDGAQTSGEPGIDGVKVYLYDQTGTTKLDSTVTAGGGKYLFDSLTDGSYVVQFISPSGYQSTSANAAGVTDDLDSDAGVNGFTGVYTIDTSQPESSTARNNPTVDAGFYIPSAGLGDYVFADNNKDGIQNTGDTPIAGVVVILYTNGVASATTVTNASGFYSFTGLTPGSSTSYSVGFTTPAGYTATLAHQGTDGTLDSDADVITGRTQSVTLAAGEFNPTLDAGFYIPSAGLGDYVFFDANKDGIQNTGDTPIAGVAVTLYINGVASATTVTNASGFYSFTGLTPGSSLSYSVGFTTPAGYTATLANQGTDDALDSDADLITGLTQSVTLAPGEFNPTLDAGFYIPGAGLGDYVFADNNKDGIQNGGDTPIAGVVVTLYTNGVASATTVTNASGFYSFTGLTPGSSLSYSVGFTTPSGYTATLANAGTDDALDSDADPITGLTQSVTLAPGEFNPTLDAGFYIPLAGLGDYVFFDANKDGIQNGGDTPISGVVVTLYINGVASATTVTNASGLYSFTGLTPGSSLSYSVGFTTPSGYTATLANAGTDDALDSDADLITGLTQSVTLAPGEFNPTLDAGFYIPSAGLGDYVFADNNKDGIQNGGDTPIAGVVVTLYINGVASTTTVTNASGFYSFTGLTPGSSLSYSVGFTTPAGYTATLAHQGTDGALDSDVDPISGRTQSVTLAPGEFNPTLDAGFYIPLAGLGDYVFFDANKDGIQNTGDTPISGAVVTLYTNGVVSATTVTNASGFYSFTGLTPGSSLSYSVGFTTPAGYTATLANAGTDDALDSDADPITGLTQSVTLAPGEFNPTLDAGFYIPSAGLGDYVFNDNNHNGIQDGGDTPISGVVVTLYTNGVASATTVTNASGFYSFTGLTPGSSTSYSVGFTAPAGYTATLAHQGGNGALDSDVDPITGRTQSVTLAPGEFNPTLDAGFYIPSAGLGDYVFFDANKDGVQDGGDTPIAGVVVTLYTNGVASATTVTNASGLYSFTGLTPGSSLSYSVGFTTPAGYTATLANQGTDDALDSDADLITGLTQSVTLAPGEFNPTLDAGFYIPGAGLGDYVFADNNKDGIQNGGDTPIAGVVVTLYTNGVASATTVTNASGFYSFTGLTPGSSLSYSVGFTAPAGYTATLTHQGGNGALDSDVDPITGRTQSVTLAPGEFNPTLDAGFYIPSAGLGDYVFLDHNNNGIQDTGDTPLAGVVVTLYTNGVASATTVSNASGFYSFTGLTPGSSYSYSVGFGPSPGYVLTISNAGTDDALDSDPDPITGRTQSITLAPGEFNPTLDAGFDPVAGLGDYVFSDNNNNGVQDAGDTPIAGVVVTLYTNGVASATTVTNASGFYSFTGLTPGSSLSYSVGFTTPSGYTAVLAHQGGNDALDSDADPITGRTQSVTLTPGEFNGNLDAGFRPSCPVNFNLVVSNDATLCNGDTLSLVATTSVQGAKVNWYLTPYDGTAFATVNSGEAVPVHPTTTTVYYAEVVTTDGCKSARKPVVIEVTTVPTPICLGNTKNTCPSTTVDLTAIQIENHSTGLTYEWYTSLDRSQTTRVTNLTAVGAGKYYLFAKSGNCYSNPTVLTVEIVDCNCQNVAGVNVGPGIAACSGDIIPVKAVLSGSATSVTWSSNGTGVFSNPTSLTSTYTPSAADITAGNVLITATTNDPDGVGGVCQAATSSLILQIAPRPDAPFNVACDDTLVCQGSSTKLIGFAPGFKINWYDGDGKLIGTTQSGGKLVVTPSKAGAIVYSAEAFSDAGCVSERSSLTITVGTCRADLAVVKSILTPGPYSIGQKITYAITVTNNGPITATGVKVTDVLPASLTYVSSTPVGQYNPASGIWNVGNLTANSDRNLLIEVGIVGTGSVRNTAIVGSPDNDPRLAYNDTSMVTIPVNACAVNPPSIVCAITEICKGGTTTLSAKGCADGTVVWSDGHTGTTIFATPSATTIYTASCVVGQCTSVASNAITVTIVEPQTPTITASADNVCPGTSVTLTASGCAGGIIEWSDKAQTGTSIVVTPYGKTTYTAQCRLANCLSNPAVKTINVNTDIPTPVIVCSTTVVCPGETMTLTVENCLGTPVWNSTTATTSSIIVTPTLGNNTYSVYCKNDACVSKSSPVYTINVVAPVRPTITASADTVCAGSTVTLTAADCNGTVYWSSGQTGPSITVSPTANISYYAQCKYRTCLSDPSNTVNIAVVTPTTPIVRVNKTLICSGELVTLTATGCNGTVVWHGVDKVGASINIYPTETKEYYATCKQGSCESDPSTKVRVTVNTSTAPAPTVVASTLATCNNGLVSLTATGCVGTVKWSDGQTGSVVSVTATTSNHEFYALCLPTSGTACGTGKSNVVNINVTPTPTPSIVRCLCSADTICPGEQVKLSVKDCQGTPYWSTGETTTSIVVSPTVTTSYTVYCQDGVCQSTTTDGYKITVIPVTEPTITASATTVAPGETVTLTATGCNGTVIWSANDINGNNQGASIVVRPEGTQTYYAQCKFRNCLSDPSVTIVINPGDCVAKAGTLVAVNGTICGGSSSTVTVAATLNGGLVQPTGYSVVYLLTKDGVVQQTSATPSFVVSSDAGNYAIQTLVYNGNVGDKNYFDLSAVHTGITTSADVLALIGTKCADLDGVGAQVTVHVIAPPTLSATSLTVCSGGTVALTATGCTGTVTWSDGTEGATYTKPIYTDQWLTAICTVDGCASSPSASVHVTLAAPAIPIIVSDKPAVCVSETLSLTATGCEGGTYIWSDGTTGSALTVTPTSDVSYRVRCKVGECLGDWSAYTTIKVGAPSAPTISIAGGSGNITTCFGAPVTLVAEGCGPNSYVTWSNNQVGNSITVSLSSTETFSARCCNSNACKSVPSNQITVTVLPKVPQPTVSDITNTCPILTADLSRAVSSNPATTGGVFEYYTDAALSSASKVADPAHVGTGTYYVVERTTNGCVGLPVAIHVQITTCEEQPCDPQNPATANAGADASVCAAKSFQLSGVMGGAGKTAHWTTSGSGTFDNSYALNATYTASPEDVLSGKVTLTLSVSTNNAACPVATDDMLLTIDGIKSPVSISVVSGALNLCYGDSVVLKALPNAPGYKWSDNQTTQSIVVKKSGVYSVQLYDGKGCSSVKSDDVVVNVSEPVLPPLVHNLRNTCPSKIVDLTTALSSTNPGSTYTYRICECNTSNIVVRPDSVCEGTYWIVEKNALGCVSKPSKVVVKVFNCATDTLDTDVSIAKTANTAFVKNGEPVTYTITVKNEGSHTAKNIDVRDVLPAGLELVPVSSPSYKVSNGTITQTIDSLQAGASTAIVFAAKLTVKGKDVVNTAEITYLDNKDTNLANNTSSVTVKDTTAQKHSLIGLAKAVLGTPRAEGDSLIKVSYQFVVTNFGDDTLKHVQVGDDLAYAFSPNSVLSTKLTLSNSESTLKLNPAFTGAGSNSDLLDNTSYIKPGASELIVLDVTVKRAAGDSTKSFNNYGSATAFNSVTIVSDISTSGGDADPDGDGDPTNNTSAASFTLSTAQPQGPSIGLALAVVKIEQQPDSSYNVTYKATIKNFGDVDLKGISVTDSLSKVFASPVSYSVVGSPVTGSGSTLVANAGFDGNTQPNLLGSASTLAAGVLDTVVFVVNVKTNGNNGPFYSTATAEGSTLDGTQVVKDISNNGIDPNPVGSTSTTVRFDLPKGLLGVAKSVGTPTLVSDGVYDIPYTIILSNLGSVDLKKVQVVDNLSETFGHGALIASNQIAITGTGTVTVNPDYSGQGLITQMLVDSASTLAVGAKATLSFTVRVDVRSADSLTFYNTALASALTPTDEVVEDVSTAGTNDDPDNDLDPRNNSQTTPIVLNGLSSNSYIGVAMAVRDTVRQSDGSYNVTYQIVVKAYGPDPLKSVSVSDTLSKVFNNLTGSTYTLVSAPIITSTGSALKLNPNFNGSSDPLLVLGDSTSTLAAGKVDTIQVVVNVASSGSTTTFLNSAYAQAVAKSGTVSDVSTSGLNPDLNGNGNPTDSNEREATALNLPPTFQTIFIPEGFSPNNDGVNDLFVIRGTAGLTVSMDVYNRWGNLVYTNADYHNDWNGKANTGTVVDADANGVPDGTYYYVINLSDGRKFVRYMTINR